MLNNAALVVLAELGRKSLGVFHIREALALKVSRKQISSLCASGVLTRELPGVYRLDAVARSPEQALWVALKWAGDDAAAYGGSAGMQYRLEGVASAKPEIVVPVGRSMRSDDVVVHRATSMTPLMIRTHHGMRLTGVEGTLVALAHSLDDEASEIACEDARRRKLTTVPALRTYLERFGRRGLAGAAATRALLDQLDAVHASRSTLEVKTRRLLVANGIADFEREFPMAWNGRTYRYDFAFPATRTILETNGKRWHNDSTDYEHDQEKWSVPGRLGWRIVFATWQTVTREPERVLADLRAARAA